MIVFKLKHYFCMTLVAMDINFWRKSDLPLMRPCFWVSEKGRGFFYQAFLRPILLISLFQYSSRGPPCEALVHPCELGPTLVSRVTLTSHFFNYT